MRLFVALLLLCLVSHSVPAAEPAEITTPDSITVAELVKLLGKKKPFPQALRQMEDLNPDDIYVEGLDVLTKDLVVVIAGEEIPAKVELYVNAGKLGGLKVLQSYESYQKTATQVLYETTRDELEAAGLTPDKRDAFGDGTSHWTVNKDLQVTISRGYGTQGMYFYIADAKTQPLNSRFFVAKREAEEREYGAGGGFWF